MKIISWNVNGLRACMKKGFVEKIQELDADVYCIQEIKSTRKQAKLEISGYEAYWNSSRRRGYSGVLVLSRVPPISVREGLGLEQFDIEGRILTLEFEDFYLINVYQPMSKGRLSRDNYRSDWDDAFFKYLKALNKPMIICGDFNVAHTYIDIYPENLRNEKNPVGFQPIERAKFERLLHWGLVDVYRLQNPETRGYTWWSYRLFKRREDRGWRLDYFLVSQRLLPTVLDTEILSHIHGSDHCPISLEVTTSISRQMTWTATLLSRLWDGIDWPSYERILFEKQQAVARAVRERNRSQIDQMQDEIINLPEARALAVRHVSETESEVGTDGVRWETSSQKMQATFDLKVEGYVCQPLRCVVIFDGKKDRRINIPTYRDRAMQTLVRYALEPVAETTADRKSFGFRKGRSGFDVDHYIRRTLEGSKVPLWVLRADVKSYYDTISHRWILRNLPLKAPLKAYLNAGIILNGELFPAEEVGISQGSGISPVIGNMVLDGLQSYIQRRLYGGAPVENYAYGDLIRFADDILVFAKSEAQAKEIKSIVADFLSVRGLKLSEEKSSIRSIQQGFAFLGRYYHLRNGKVIAEPSKDNLRRFEEKLMHYIERHTGSVEELIIGLNKMIVGYTSYHRMTDAHDAFRHLDVVIQALLIQKVRALFPRQYWTKLEKKFWYKISKDEYIFSAEDKRHLQVIRCVDTVPIRYLPVKTNYNHFLDTEYKKSLDYRRAVNNKGGKYKRLWKSQDGKCYLCGKAMLPSHQLTVIDTEPLGKFSAYIHIKCSEHTVEYRDASHVRGLDVSALLEQLNDYQPEENTTFPTHDYGALREHFRKEHRQGFMMTFQEIGRLLGQQLGYLESTQSNFWYDTAPNCISHTWTDNGYAIRKLVLSQEQVYFLKANHSLTAFSVPTVFWDKKIPKNAQDEIEAFLGYIQKKYKI
ncbi:exodeoxyribonuclease III [Bengtsoniella intestinalis]|uniref:exodeoxyribonuclease III n=1 Tax=Bengtsoniella intestinalis TaxID=3073143 RepID=UPI00391F049A